MDPCPAGSVVHGTVPGKNTRVGCAFSSPWDLLDPGDQSHISCVFCTAGRFFTTEPPGKSQCDGWASLRRDRRHRQSVTWPEQQRLERYRGKQTPRARPPPVARGRGERIPPRASEGAQPCHSLIWDSWPPDRDGTHFHHFKPSSVWPLEANTHTEANATRIGHCCFCKRICNIAGKVPWRVLKAPLYHSWGKKDRHYHVEAVDGALVLKSLITASCSTHVVLEPCYFENEMD